MASKICFELGLHQSTAEAFSPDEPGGCSFSQKLFCCVYMWDHRCAFATGLPFTMQLADIHEKCLETVREEENMTDLARLIVSLGRLSSFSLGHD